MPMKKMWLRGSGSNREGGCDVVGERGGDFSSIVSSVQVKQKVGIMRFETKVCNALLPTDVDENEQADDANAVPRVCRTRFTAGGDRSEARRALIKFFVVNTVVFVFMFYVFHGFVVCVDKSL